jgi:hypothetical protein
MASHNSAFVKFNTWVLLLLCTKCALVSLFMFPLQRNKFDRRDSLDSSRWSHHRDREIMRVSNDVCEFVSNRWKVKFCALT